MVLVVECGVFGFEFLRYCDSFMDVYGVVCDMFDLVGLLDCVDIIVIDFFYGDKCCFEIGIVFVSEFDLFFMDELIVGMFFEEMKLMVDFIE